MNIYETCYFLSDHVKSDHRIGYKTERNVLFKAVFYVVFFPFGIYYFN